MNRYIDADKIRYREIQNEVGFGWYTSRENINGLPSEDVEPVRHGRWIFSWSDKTHNYFTCSECGERIKNPSYETTTIVKIRFPYSHCGAKMDGEVNQ